MFKKSKVGAFVFLSVFFCMAAWGISAVSDQSVENPYTQVFSSVVNMYHPDRFPDIYAVTQPNCLFTSLAEYEKIKKGEKPTTIASHGSLWNYDANVPIIFYGKGIKKGYLGGKADLIDIAPTLAYLTGVQPPSASQGRVLSEILEPEAAAWNSEDRPKVVVLFSLDQCRADDLNSFEDAFAFLKQQVIAKGASFAEGHISYAKTETAVSHTSVGTGTVPGIHGITGNNILLSDNSFPLAIDDGNKTDFGHGNLSPHNLLVATFADELDRRYNNRSIILSSSGYARAAIGIAGHGAYYQDKGWQYSGADKDIVFSCNMYSGVPYTNSDYYRLPDYLDVNNNPDIHVKSWLKKYYALDIETTPWTHDLTLTDSSPYSASDTPVGHASAAFAWGETYTFSYPLIKKGAAEPFPLQYYQNYNKETTVLTDKYSNATVSPFFDLWNTDLNLMIMEKENVGKDNIPDFAFFHLKSLDVVGHRYGVYAGETYNYLFFADYMIKKVIRWLDKNVGEGKYTCVFFADHGGTNVIANGTWIVNEDVKSAMETKFGTGILRNISNDQIWLNTDMLKEKDISLKTVASWMEDNFSWVFRAYTRYDVSGEPEPVKAATPCCDDDDDKGLCFISSAAFAGTNPLDVFKGKKGEIRIAGGTAHIPVMKEAAKRIAEINPDIQISIAGGGSGVGIKQVGEGLVNIGNSGRAPTDEEIKKFDLKLFKWAIDGVGIVVHPKNPVKSLTQAQVKDIFAGKITNWKVLGGEDKGINVYTRDEASGTREVFFEKALDKGEISPKANVVVSNGAVKSAVSNDPYSIGYVSVGHIDETVSAVALDGVVPATDTVKQGKYKVARGLFSNTKGDPAGLTKLFIEFLFTPEGQKIVQENGFIPVK